jgi:hypothetical protein
VYAGPPGRPHWEAREDASRTVLVALYLRDALGARDPSGLPRLLGTGLAEVPPADDHTTYWWMRWWISVVEPEARGWGVPLQEIDDGGLVVLPEEGAEDYIALVRHHLDDARTWADVAHRAHAETAMARSLGGDDFALARLIRENEAELGRVSKPFRLRIEVLPLAGSGVWWIGDDAIAVDETTRSEPILYRDALAPVVAQLV